MSRNVKCLTDAQKQEIIDKFYTVDGITKAGLGREYGVSARTIGRILDTGSPSLDYQVQEVKEELEILELKDSEELPFEGIIAPTKVGDIVVILCTNTGWVEHIDELDEYIGTFGKVEAFDDFEASPAVCLELQDGKSWWFAKEWLHTVVSAEMVPQAPQEVQEEVVDPNPYAGKDCFALVPGAIITIQYQGNVYTVDSTHKAFDTIVELSTAGAFEEAVRLAEPTKAINEFTQGEVEIKGETVYYDGEPVKDGLAEAILRLMAEGDDGFKKLVAFLNRVKKNPSYKSRQELFGFIKAADIEITDDGMLICWKRIRHDWTDCHTGKIDNSIGATVTMARTEVNDDSRQTCSAGLHCCAKSYLSAFSGDRTVKVLVDPEDVVSIPHDYNDAKMRTCKYVVLEEVENV